MVPGPWHPGRLAVGLVRSVNGALVSVVCIHSFLETFGVLRTAGGAAHWTSAAFMGSTSQRRAPLRRRLRTAGSTSGRRRRYDIAIDEYRLYIASIRSIIGAS